MRKVSRLFSVALLGLSLAVAAQAEDVKANPKTKIYHTAKGDPHFKTCTTCKVMPEEQAIKEGYRKCASGFQKKETAGKAATK